MTDLTYGVYAVTPEKLDGCEYYLQTCGLALCYTNRPPAGAARVTDLRALPAYVREWVLESMECVKRKALISLDEQRRKNAAEFLIAFEKELSKEMLRVKGGGDDGRTD